MTERVERYRRSNGGDVKARIRRARAYARFLSLRDHRAPSDLIDRAWGWVLRWDSALHSASGYVAIDGPIR